MAQKLYEKDPSKMGQWDAEMIPSQGASGGETSSDEGEPIPLHPMHQYPSQLSISEGDLPRGYHMPILVSEESKPVTDIRHANPQFSNQNRLGDFGMGERQLSRGSRSGERADDSRVTESSVDQMYKCKICTVSVRSKNELQVHNFVEHNIEAEGSSEGGETEGRQKRGNDDIGVKEDRKRQKIVDDT